MLGIHQVTKTVAKRSGLTIPKTRQIIEATLQVVTDALAVGEDVSIKHLGRFRVHQYPSRTIPDPNGSGSHLVILPKKVIKFKPARSLRQAVRVDTLTKVQPVAEPAEPAGQIEQAQPVEVKTPEQPMPIQTLSTAQPTPPATPETPAKKNPNWLVLFSKLKKHQLKNQDDIAAPSPDKAKQPIKIDGAETGFKEATAPVKISFQDLSSIQVDKKILNLLPELFSRRHKAVPIEATDQDITVAMVDPENLETIQLIKKSTNRNVTPVLASSEDISRILNQYSGLEAEVASAVKDTSLGISKQEIAEAQQENVELSGEDSPTARIVTSLLRRAVREKSSDVHIEPYEKAIVVRFRIDGVLKIRVKLPKEILPAIISRLKILSSLKIDEHRLPQDGRFRLNIDNHDIDFRLSTLPVADGEKAVMRILDKSQGILSIEEIGVRGKGYDILKANIKKSYGMTLVTGPTGSGKTTTLYALLGQLMDVGVNIITLENPIEYRIEGINQSQINPDIDYNFATGLRAIVRQDPDIIMVGEVRDKETAEIAIQSALTGHIVLSTLHTNNASGAIPRLIDMGVEPFLISSSLNTIVAQRLARKLCEQCKEKHQPSAKELEVIQDELNKMPADSKQSVNLQQVSFYQAKGCDACNHTGYSGRTGVFEVLDVSEKIENLILGRVTDTKIEQEAISGGMVTMMQDGILKAIDGVTSLEEVWRVTRD